MKPTLIIAAAAIMTVAISAPVGTVAYAQQSGTQMQQPQKNQMGGQMGNQQGGMMMQQGQGGQAGMQGGQAGMRGGMMGGGQGGGMMGMMGQRGGMMGMMKKMQKMRKQMMGKNFMVRKKAYSNADIKRMIDGRLAKFGFSRLKAGDVADGTKKQGPKTAIVDVLSTKGEFLFKVEVNRKNGMATIIE